ncbi:MAG: GNAT family N-acetyltransferase [Dehalococcoidia bacterium]|nr:GNAT family N-acetyltransferase [Dehalococcoidia bacterium]
MADVSIRSATPADASTIVEFVRGLATFEHEPLEHVRLTVADVLRDGFPAGAGARPLFEVLIAERARTPLGFALFFPHYSTWEGAAALYIEDLFVVEAARREGVGRALVAAVARVARERGHPRVDLAVLDWNPARAFYARLGFAHQPEWLAYRVEGASLAALAEAAPAIEG